MGINDFFDRIKYTRKCGEIVHNFMYCGECFQYTTTKYSDVQVEPLPTPFMVDATFTQRYDRVRKKSLRELACKKSHKK